MSSSTTYSLVRLQPILVELLLVVRTEYDERYGRALCKPVERNLWDCLLGFLHNGIERINDAVKVFIILPLSVGQSRRSRASGCLRVAACRSGFCR